MCVVPARPDCVRQRVLSSLAMVRCQRVNAVVEDDREPASAQRRQGHNAGDDGEAFRCSVPERPDPDLRRHQPHQTPGEGFLQRQRRRCSSREWRVATDSSSAGASCRVPRSIHDLAVGPKVPAGMGSRRSCQQLHWLAASVWAATFPGTHPRRSLARELPPRGTRNRRKLVHRTPARTRILESCRSNHCGRRLRGTHSHPGSRAGPQRGVTLTRLHTDAAPARFLRAEAVGIRGTGAPAAAADKRIPVHFRTQTLWRHRFPFGQVPVRLQSSRVAPASAHPGRAGCRGPLWPDRSAPAAGARSSRIASSHRTVAHP